MLKRAAFTFVAMAMAVVAAVGSGRASTGAWAADAECNPPPPPPMPPTSEFVSRVDNTYFPLEPGTTFLYRGQEEGEPVVDRVVVTDMTRTIIGVEATVVKDDVEVGEEPSEKTSDWYAQDSDGNVWYLGDDAFEFVNGHWIRSDDSWEAGRDGAKPGIIMEAHPKVGDAYAQEDYPGHAEDMAQVLSTHATVSVPYGTFHHALKTMECTPLEPGVFDAKWYGRGVGEVKETTVKGGSANLELVSVTHE